MELSKRNLLDIASRDFILDHTSADDIFGFIKDQIKHPFDSSSINYFKRLRKEVTDKDLLDSYCTKILDAIEDRYEGIEIDLENVDRRLGDLTEAVYKFFVRDIRKLMYIFLREYIFNNKNRKGLLSPYMDIKLASYPKDQYGKKEYYILITKLPSILQDIASDESIDFSEFLKFITRHDDVALYVDFVQRYYDDNIIIDQDIFRVAMKMFEDSDSRNGIINKLQIAITNAIILPYIEEIGMEDVRFGTIDPEDEDDLTDDDDE